MLLLSLAAACSYLTAASPPAHAAGTLPCDLYGSAGTPCVAAYSTVRALSSSYDGYLYEVTRADGAVDEIGLLSPGGYVDAATQDSFCAGSTCTITKIYDQSGQGNTLFVEPKGVQGVADSGAVANALPITVAGHEAYGVYMPPHTGYHTSGAGNGTAKNGQPETIYEVASGTNVNSGCCSDFGNTESAEQDDDAGTMDALNLSLLNAQGSTGAGPWVQADLENGVYQGYSPINTANSGNASKFVTALLKNNGQTTFALKGGDATTGGLTTLYSGALPPPLADGEKYTPMRQEGGVVLGTGGDNSDEGTQSFFEGVMTAGYSSDATDTAVQADIVSVGYSGASSGGGPGEVIVGPGGKCVDVAGDDVGGDGAVVQLWDCQALAADQQWTGSDVGGLGHLSTLGRCLDLDGDGTANGTKLELWDCNTAGGQQWVPTADGGLLNPQSGRCLDDPSGNTADGTPLQLYDCQANDVAQQFRVFTPIIGPGGKCLDVAGNDVGGDGAGIDLWDCIGNHTDNCCGLHAAADQQLSLNPNGTITTLGRCLDLDGDGTVNGTQLELWDCNSAGGQQWVPQANGELLNPQSGRCLDDPSGNTANGTLLQLYDCQPPSDGAQQFHFNGVDAGGTPGTTIVGPGGKCVDVAGNDTGGDGAVVDLWDCQGLAADQHWTGSDVGGPGHLSTLGRCLDLDGDGTVNGTKLELWDCNTAGGQQWVPQANGELLNPQSGRCLDDPSGNTANGTQLQLYDCQPPSDGAQQFRVMTPIIGPGGKCVDVASTNAGSDGAAVQLEGCYGNSPASQQWWLNPNGYIMAQGRCLDLIGNGTANGTLLDLSDCNANGGQKWVPQANGTILNPQSGRCLDDPSGNTTNGTQLQLYDCQPPADGAQQFQFN